MRFSIIAFFAALAIAAPSAEPQPQDLSSLLSGLKGSGGASGGTPDLSALLGALKSKGAGGASGGTPDLSALLGGLKSKGAGGAASSGASSPAAADGMAGMSHGHSGRR